MTCMERDSSHRESRTVERDILLIAHEQDYVDRFLSGSLDPKEVRRIGLEPWTDAFVPRTMRIIGGRWKPSRTSLASEG